MNAWSTAPTSFILVFILLVGVGFGTWMFSRWIGRNPALKEDEKVKRWELYLTGVGSLTAVMVGLMAFIRYIDQRERELAQQVVEQAQKTREFNIQIYGRSTDVEQATRVLLNEAVDLAASLATLEDLGVPEGRIARARFERLYHGQLVLYENDDVSNAMVNFRDALLKWERTGRKPIELRSEDRTKPSSGPRRLEKRNSDFMRQLALQLSCACRKELDRLSGRKRKEPQP